MNIRAILLFTILSLAGATVPGETTLSIRRSVAINGPDILLKELVQNPDSLPAGWADRSVLRSPAPCKPEQVPLTSIAYALQQYPDMDKVVLRGDPNVTVERNGVELKHVRMIDAIRSYIAARESALEDAFDIELIRVPRGFRVPQGEVSVRVLGYKAASDDTGHGTFDLLVTAADASAIPVTVVAKVTRLQETWVAREDLPSGHVIGIDDIEPLLLPIRAGARTPIPCSEAIEGMEVLRTIRAGQPILRDILSQPKCALRGDLVNVTAERASLRVTLQAKALGYGRLGERILCLNESSKRRFVVELTGPRQARLVEF